MKKRYRIGFIVLLFLSIIFPSTKSWAGNDIFYLEGPVRENDERGMNHETRQQIASERYDKFLGRNNIPSSAECPNMGMGIKYIVGDAENVDGGGRQRYVYCLEFAKDCPTNGITMQHTGWVNKQVTYALYHGAVYYGEACRKETYSTGDWKMDYFVTQAAIHILNGEFSLGAMRHGMNQSNATQGEKDLAFDRVQKLVADASMPGNYIGFTGDGWIDFSSGELLLNGYRDQWVQQSNGDYWLDGVIHPSFIGPGGYEFTEQLTEYELQVKPEVIIKKENNKLQSDIRLGIAKWQYDIWSLQGDSFPVHVKATIPQLWRGGIYKAAGSNIQTICYLTWGSGSGKSTIEKNIELHIPEQGRNLIIKKTAAETGEPLSGASFSLWAYDGKKYTKKLGDFEDLGNGNYGIRNILYTSTVDGYFLIKEDKPPKHYENVYVFENINDERTYKNYGGREITMDENGFFSYVLEEPLHFRDKKKPPKGTIKVKKYDIDTKKILKDTEFRVYEWQKSKQAYDFTSWEWLAYDEKEGCNMTAQALIKTEENEGKFLIKEVEAMKGYCGLWEQEIVIENPDETIFYYEVPNYPNRMITIQKRLKKDELHWEHGNPVFFYYIYGKDLDHLEHSYHTFVEFKKENIKDMGNGFVLATANVQDIPAGTYQIEEVENVLRYVLTDVKAEESNVKIDIKPGKVINGIQSIKAQATVDLQYKNGTIQFENRKVFHGTYTHNDVKVNHFKVIYK